MAYQIILYYSLFSLLGLLTYTTSSLGYGKSDQFTLGEQIYFVPDPPKKRFGTVY